MVKVLLLSEIGYLNSEHVINNIILMPFSPHQTSPQNQSILGEIKATFLILPIVFIFIFSELKFSLRNIFLIPIARQQQTYFPGKYSQEDLFLKNLETEPNEYLYKAGYYSQSAITNNYNNAQGIILLHDNSVRTFNLKILFVVFTS